MAGIADVAQRAGLRTEFMEYLFEAVVDVLMEVDANNVRVHRNIVIKNFGTFFLLDQAERTIKSPQLPGGSAHVPARTVLRFHPSPTLLPKLNGQVAKAMGRRSRKSLKETTYTPRGPRQPAPETEPVEEQPDESSENHD